MNKEQFSLNLAEPMADIEEIIGEHYAVYAVKFPEHKDFWKALATAEANHAQWIRNLYSKANQGLISFNEKRFDKESVKEFRSRLKSMLTRIREEEISLKDALQNSLGIEKMVLEKNFFEAFVTDSPGLKGILNRIIEETREHRKRIELLLEKLA